jgi:hypothetical protein
MNAAGRSAGSHSVVPFGWQVGEDGALVEVRAEQEAIRQMVQLRGQGLSRDAAAFITLRSTSAHSAIGSAVITPTQARRMPLVRRA